MLVRDDVLKALEEARNAKTIGKSLEAKVTVYVKKELLEAFDTTKIDFAQFFIVSDFTLAGLKEEAPAEALDLDVASVIVVKAQGEKCERCWTISSKVGESEKHPTLCVRCADVVEKYYV